MHTDLRPRQYHPCRFSGLPVLPCIRPPRLRRVAAAVVWVILLAPRAGAAAPEATPTPREEAKARFARGKQLFDEKDYAGALVEFQRAYAVVPSAVTEINIAYVYVELH